MQQTESQLFWTWVSRDRWVALRWQTVKGISGWSDKPTSVQIYIIGLKESFVDMDSIKRQNKNVGLSQYYGDMTIHFFYTIWPHLLRVTLDQGEKWTLMFTYDCEEWTKQFPSLQLVWVLGKRWWLVSCQIGSWSRQLNRQKPACSWWLCHTLPQTSFWLVNWTVEHAC